jgi:glycolate oxidase FAD binding subunit
MDEAVEALATRIRAAAAAREPLRIRGGGTKDFYGNDCAGETLATTTLRGAVAYEPTELVVTAPAGTPLAELEALLAAHGQMLAFEPPHFGAGATVGGCVAAGLAGPRRASAGVAHGGVRDFVLGAKLVDGRGRRLAFGGTVMKNVAGFDVARVLAGSLGILGVITEVSLKVLPRPAAETTLRFECDASEALRRMNAWGGQPLPVSATAWAEGQLRVRLSGARAAVESACARLGGEREDAADWWAALREHALPFHAGDAPLWRVSVPSVAPSLALGGDPLVEWGGALRWLRTRATAAEVRARAAALGGHATLFRGGDRSAGAFTPLAPAVATLHRRLKAEFDPAGILNRGRMYADF